MTNVVRSVASAAEIVLVASLLKCTFDAVRWVPYAVLRALPSVTALVRSVASAVATALDASDTIYRAEPVRPARDVATREDGTVNVPRWLLSQPVDLLAQLIREDEIEKGQADVVKGIIQRLVAMVLG